MRPPLSPGQDSLEPKSDLMIASFAPIGTLSSAIAPATSQCGWQTAGLPRPRLPGEHSPRPQSIHRRCGQRMWYVEWCSECRRGL